MRADENIDFTFGNLLQNLRLLFGATETGQHLNAYRPVGKAVAEVVEVLLCEQGGRNQHGNLLVVLYGEKGRAHRDFGFTKADVAAHQAVHGQRLTHIAEYRVDRLRLVRRGFKREAVAKQLILFTVMLKGKAFFRRALGINIQQLCRDIAHLLSGFLSGA